MKAGRILYKVIPFVVIVVLLKLVAHSLDSEIISLNPIVSGIIGANVFLLGFLLSGVLTDYKESERLPGDLAATLQTIADELETAFRKRGIDAARKNLELLSDFSLMLRLWFYKEVKTRDLLAHMKELYSGMNSLEGMILPNYLVRLRQEHGNVRRMIIRIHTIRDTNFVPAGYLIAITTTVLLLLGLILMRMDPFFESLFFVGVISYLMIFLILLIRDLDNPFDYYDKSSSEDVSLKPILDVIADLSQWGDTTVKPADTK